MNRSAFFLLILALFSAATYGQNSFQTNIGGPNLEMTRPRIVDDRTSAVKASVVVNTASIERIVFDLVNGKREGSGLKPLIWSDEVASIVRNHSQSMAVHGFFSHRGLDGKMVSDRADRQGLTKWRSIGENIAFNRGYDAPVEKAVELWMQSTSHRHNLLSSQWRESAIGVAVAADGSYYFTQVFLVRK